MRLWLDDIRDLRNFGHDGDDWVWAGNAEDAIQLLRTGGVAEASFDHDLGIPSCHACRCAAESQEEYGRILSLGCPHGAKTGYDVVLYLEEHPEFWPPNGVRVHSMNPAGRARMEQVIKRHYETKH